MSERATLLIEIGCEEIPARMISGAGKDLHARILGLIDAAGLEHGDSRSWWGPRRLAVCVEALEARQADHEETLLGPPAKVAFDPAGRPTKAAVGFAAKQGVDPQQLRTIETERGSYAGFVRAVEGKGVGVLLAEGLPAALASMSFPKTMRWGDGTPRWARPVHWILALHGASVLPLQAFGVLAGRRSWGHRFLSDGPLEIDAAEDYAERLLEGRVLVDAAERRDRIEQALERRSEEAGGRVVEDVALLDEVSQLVEWPGVVLGRFDPSFLKLPAELLATTLRHHQKCFSVRHPDGTPMAAFLAVANTDEDREGNICRGNEWVVSGRLEDARFFWREDLKRTLADRSGDLERVVFHAKAGSYADKAARMEQLARRLATLLALDESARKATEDAARWCKNDLVTGTVGEFPELQGRVGGLLLRAEGAEEAVVGAVYEHYQPVGPDDSVPPSSGGCVVAVVDKLDSIQQLLSAGETPSGSRDPYGLRRAGAGILRILHEHRWTVGVGAIAGLAGDDARGLSFLLERLERHFRELGFSANEIQSVLRPRVDASAAAGAAVIDVAARLEAIKQVRGREDFRNLVKLTERVDNILTKDADALDRIADEAGGDYREVQPAALRLAEMVAEAEPLMTAHSAAGSYPEVVEALAGFIAPVEAFFNDVLVVDREDPAATRSRRELLGRLRTLLTRYFDIRELAGQAERRST